MKWYVLENLPAPDQMDDEMLQSHIDSLTAEIAALQLQIDQAEDGEDMTTVEEMLTIKETSFSTACEDPRSSCPEQNVQSGTGGDGTENTGNLMLILAIVGGVLFLAVSIGLLMRRNDEEKIFDNGPVWQDDALPIHDTVANSMYGGTEEIFKQPPPTLPIQETSVEELSDEENIASRAPEIPESGLPEGWTMAQWEHYGQAWIDQQNES